MSYFTTGNKSVVSPAPAKETPAVVLNAAENPPPPPTPSHDGLDHDPHSGAESPPLETPSESQGKMSSTTPEEVVASPHGNGSGDGKHAKGLRSIYFAITSRISCSSRESLDFFGEI